MEQHTGCKLRKEYVKVVYCHPAYLTYMYIMRNAGMDEAQAGFKFAGRNINQLRYADGTTLMAESKEELDIFLELSCFSSDPTDIGNLISCSSAFSKSTLNI